MASLSHLSPGAVAVVVSKLPLTPKAVSQTHGCACTVILSVSPRTAASSATSKAIDLNAKRLVDIPPLVSDSITQFPASVAVIVEQIDALLLAHTPSQIAHFTQSLVRAVSVHENARIIIQYHQDVPQILPSLPCQPQLNLVLKSLATTHITLLPPDEWHPYNRATTVINKPHGKMSVQTVGFRIVGHLDIETFDIAVHPPPLPQPESTVPLPSAPNQPSTDVKPDPTAATRLFNLSLTDEQRKQRSQVVLPYLQAQSEAATSQPPFASGAGLIFYEHDEGDDYDEEDPDDDLDI